MPYENGAWRPLNNGELEAAVQRLMSLVDADVSPEPEDHVRDWRSEVTSLFSDERGYIWHEYRKISDHVLLGHFLDDHPIRYFRTLSYVADVTRKKGLLRLESLAWEQNMPVLLRALCYSADEQTTTDQAKLAYARLYQQAEAAKRLRARGFKIGLYGSNISMEEAEESRLYGLLASEAANRGGASLFHGLRGILENFWCPDFQRYVVNLNVHTAPPKSSPSLPLGYLYNLAAKVASLGTGPGSPAIGDRDYLGLAIDICALHALEPYSWAEVMLPSDARLMDLLGDLGKLQFSFTLPQIDERDVTRTLRAAFSWIDPATEQKLGWSLADAISFCQTVTQTLPDKDAINMSKSTLHQMLNSVAAERFDRLWATFVHRPATVNTCFCNPVVATTANAYFKPLIGYADSAVVGLRSVSAGGWYEAIASALREAGVRNVEEQIGNGFEVFVRSCLAPYGVVYSGNFESAHGNGDVDAAIGTDSTILLFELKRKALTRLAQSGDIIGVLLDLIRSAVRAQAQLAKIEYILRKDGQLALGSQVLQLNNRTIKRIVLSWHDYGVFHDHGFLINFFGKLVGSTLTSPDATRVEDITRINKGLRELAHWTVRVNQVAPRGYPFGNCFFYAIGHLLAIMRFAKTDKELERHLTFNESVASEALDFYVEYRRWAKDILPHLSAI